MTPRPKYRTLWKDTMARADVAEQKLRNEGRALDRAVYWLMGIAALALLEALVIVYLLLR